MITLSVIIPTRNRSKYLSVALESITIQTLPQEFFEVIVVDNGSTDTTKETVQSFKTKIKNLIYLYDENPGLHIGRHRGLMEAESDILVYADDDIEAFPSWLEGVIESFNDESVVLVGGKVLPKFEVEPPKWIVDMWESGGRQKVIPYLSILDLGDETMEINPYYVFGCNFSIRKDILLRAGGFHPDGMPKNFSRYRGDGETHVSRFILENDLKAIYNPKASTYHLVSKGRMTKEYFAQRAFNQGISDSFSDIRSNKKRRFIKAKFKVLLKKYLLQRDVSIDIEYLKGYKFHQSEVKKDPKLLEWVKRYSYINKGEIL